MPSKRKPAPAEVRVWAQSVGVEVGERGRISEEVYVAYADDQSGKGPHAQKRAEVMAACDIHDEEVEDETIEAYYEDFAYSPRSDILALAEHYVNGDRNALYGDPNADFQRTGEFWSTYLSGVFQRKLAERELSLEDDTLEIIFADLVNTHDVAWMMVLLKASRSTVSPHKGDHYADAAGYIACGYDCSVHQTGDNWAAGELLG